jgi:hypothetical protein
VTSYDPGVHSQLSENLGQVVCSPYLWSCAEEMFLQQLSQTHIPHLLSVLHSESPSPAIIKAATVKCYLCRILESILTLCKYRDKRFRMELSNPYH